MKYFNAHYSLDLSGWIGNLGVVPLLRLAFFLFKPLRLSLLALLVSVIFVLDTILKLLIEKNKNPNSLLLYLPFFGPYVKTLVIVGALLFERCVCEEIGPAQNMQSKILFSAEKNIVLAVGEVKELNLRSLGRSQGTAGANNTKFSIGNKMVISCRYFPQKDGLLIRGKGQGYSEIVVWKGPESFRYQVYVISKRQELSTVVLKQMLAEVGSTIEAHGSDSGGGVLVLSGKVGDLRGYYHLMAMAKKYPHLNLHLNQFSQIHLSTSLRDLIIADIEGTLRKELVAGIFCEDIFLRLYCNYDQSTPPSKVALDFLGKKYWIDWHPLPNIAKRKNYLLKLKFLQLEHSDGKEFSLGPSTFRMDWWQALKLNQHWVGSSEIVLENQKIKVSTLAEPQLLIKEGSPAALKMGTNIPLQVDRNLDESYVADDDEELGELGGLEGAKRTRRTSSSSASLRAKKTVRFVEWGFAGLNLFFELKIQGKELELQYQAEYSSPVDNNIVGSKTASKFTIPLLTISSPSGTMLEFFHIGLRTVGDQRKSIPLLGDIPLLGALFSTQVNQSTYKQIYGLVSIEEFVGENKKNEKNEKDEKNGKNEQAVPGATAVASTTVSVFSASIKEH
ncbi:MAG: hypothetical protein HQK53_12340 [Oligoflexia bacterium]|nr:hypothetical protein [Oligoflexia bacterium]